MIIKYLLFNQLLLYQYQNYTIISNLIEIHSI